MLSAFSSFEEQRCIRLSFILSTMMNNFFFFYPAGDDLAQDSSLVHIKMYLVCRQVKDDVTIFN